MPTKPNFGDFKPKAKGSPLSIVYENSCKKIKSIYNLFAKEPSFEDLSKRFGPQETAKKTTNLKSGIGKCFTNICTQLGNLIK